MKKNEIIENGFFVKFKDGNNEHQYYLHFDVRNFLIDFDKNIALPALWFAGDVKKLTYSNDVVRLATCWHMDYYHGCGIAEIETKYYDILFKRMIDYFGAEVIKLSKEDIDNDRFIYIENILSSQKIKKEITEKINKAELKNNNKI